MRKYEISFDIRISTNLKKIKRNGPESLKHILLTCKIIFIPTVNKMQLIYTMNLSDSTWLVLDTPGLSLSKVSQGKPSQQLQMDSLPSDLRVVLTHQHTYKMLSKWLPRDIIVLYRLRYQLEVVLLNTVEMILGLMEQCFLGEGLFFLFLLTSLNSNYNHIFQSITTNMGYVGVGDAKDVQAHHWSKAKTL